MNWAAWTYWLTSRPCLYLSRYDQKLRGMLAAFSQVHGCTNCTATLIQVFTRCRISPRNTSTSALPRRSNSRSPLTSTAKSSLTRMTPLDEGVIQGAVRAQYLVLDSQIVGLAWMDEAEAGRAVFRLLGHEARLVLVGGLGHCPGSLQQSCHTCVIGCCTKVRLLCDHDGRKPPQDQAFIPASRYRAGPSVILFRTRSVRFAISLSMEAGVC